MVLDIALGILLALGIIIGGVILIALLIRLYSNIDHWIYEFKEWVHEIKEKDEFVGGIALILIIVAVIIAVNFIVENFINK